MNIDRLAKFVGKSDLHRQVLGTYRGPYALGVTQTSEGIAALSLSVEHNNPKIFPREVQVDGEPVPIIVHANWSVPRPQ